MSEKQTRYYIQRVVEEPASELSSDDVITIAEAARRLDVTVQAISQHLDAGRLTTIIDTSAPPRQGRRLVLREEVEQYRAARTAAGGEDGAD